MNVRTLLACAAAALAAPTAVRAAAIGDQAAPIEVSDWLKGQAFSLADVKGKKIVVVEFWATWCGPCVASIPHLSEMQAQFADRGVVFLGVTSEDAATAKPFVDKMGGKMDYIVACDKNGATSKGYLGAFGVRGIPHAFIVDRDGNIAWHGHPMSGLDKELEKLAAVPVKEDPMAAMRSLGRTKLAEFVQLAGSGGDAARLDSLAAEITAIHDKTGGIEPGAKLNLAELRRSSRFQILLRDYQRAVAAGKPSADLDQLELAAAPFAPADFKFSDYRGNFNLQRVFQDYYRAVTAEKPDNARIAELAARLELVESSDVDAQNEMAWTLLTDESVKIRDFKLALKFARAANGASGGTNPDVLETYARALHDGGNRDEALKVLAKAVDLTDDDTRKSELRETLENWRSGK